MGSACCVASRDRTIINGTGSEVLQRNIRYSPSWSFRWDNNRGRVAGEDTAINWSSDGQRRYDRMDNKSRSTVGATYASEDGSPLNTSQSLTWKKSPISEMNTDSLPLADHSTSRTSLTEVKDSVQSPAISDSSPTKLSPILNSASSLSTSSLSSKSHLFPGSSTPSRWACRSPGHQLFRQVSGSRIPTHKSPSFSISEESSFLLPGWSNESNRGSNVGSSDSWSLPAFTDHMAASHRERKSFDSDAFGSQRGKIAHIDIQTCGVCSNLLTERSSWRATEVAAVAVLICGHVYHAECLENITNEVHKYDPVCPVCTFGEKKTLKLSEKALKVEFGSRNRKKRLRKRIVSSDQDDDSSVFGDFKNSGEYEEKSIKMTFGKPFLKRHFSFGSKGSRLLSENHSDAARKKVFFWSKSTKQ